MKNKDYRNTNALSRSELWTLINKTPAHFKYEQEHPKEDTPSLLFGRACHKMILEPESFDDEFMVAPNVDRRTKEGKEAYARFLDESNGKEVITQADFDKICDMAVAVNSNAEASRWLNGEHETSWFWTDSETGVDLKCRPDCLTTIDGKKYIVDYKTTDSCAGYSFEHSVKKYGYKFQAAWYTEGMFQNTFEEYGFAFVAQEKEAPYCCRVYVCTPEFVAEGYEQFRQAVETYKICNDTGRWFGYEGLDNEFAITPLCEEGE